MVPATLPTSIFFERHLSIGSADNQTLSNADLDGYDYSISGYEDIFFDVDAGNDLTLPYTGTQTATDQILIIKASNIYRPDSASSGNVTTQKLTIPASATFTADGNTINLKSGGTPFSLTGTFNEDTSTFKYTAIADTTITATDYNNLETSPYQTVSAGGVGYVVSGAGSTQYNGTYDVPEPPGYLISGTAYHIYGSGGTWHIWNWDYDFYTCTGADPTLCTWEVVGGAAPAPTVAANAGSTANYTFASGTFNISGNYQNGDGSHTANINADTNDPTLNIDGYFVNNASATFTASGTGTFSVGSHFSNVGTFTDSGGVVVFDGSALQTITAYGTNEAHDFENVTITNASVGGVSFADSTTVSGTLTNLTPASKITFNSGSTYTFSTVNIVGSSGNLITLTASDITNWTFAPTTITSISYVNVNYSSNTGTSFCAIYSTGSNNTGWDVSATGSCAPASAVTTNSASSVTSVSATLNGNITVLDGGNATVRGFKYSLVGQQDDSSTYDSGDFSTGAYTKSFTSLTSGTTYYIRAYATNPSGTFYGEWSTFSTLDPTVTLSNSASISETSGTNSLTASLSNLSSKTVTVNLAFSGTATNASDYTRSATSITITAGQATGAVTISSVSDTTDETDETVIVDISSVTNATESGSQQTTVTILDDDSAPTVSFDLSSGSSTEVDDFGIESVSLSAASGKTITVDYTTAGTATGGGVDYTISGSGTLTFVPGDTIMGIAILEVNDALDEDSETAVITLGDPTNATIGAIATYTHTILDNDSSPTVAFSSSAGSGSEVTTSVNIPILLSTVSGRSVAVNYSVSAGTATGGGSDYTLASGTATITAGQSTVNIPLTVIDDASYEENETLTVLLSAPTNATLGANTDFVYTVLENDSIPTVSVVLGITSGLESSASTSISFVLSAMSYQSVSVNYTISGSAAGNGVDYTLTGGTVTIVSGSISSTVNLGIVNDSLAESDETVVITLSSPTAASLGTATATYTIVDNDTVNDTTSDNSSTASTRSSSSGAASNETTTTTEGESTVLSETMPLTYNLLILITDKNGTPLPNTKVELHSNILTAYSDENGYVYFAGVVPGKHKIIVADKRYAGSQEIEVGGSEEKIEIVVKVEPKTSIWIWVAIGAGSMVTVTLLFAVIKYLLNRKKHANFTKVI